MKMVKIFGSLVVLGIFLYIIVINFSVVNYRYQCNGISTLHGKTKPIVLYMKIEKYRWWVHLWSKSDGNLWVEVPNQETEYFSKIELAGENILIFDDTKSIKGKFSMLSNHLNLELPSGLIEGICTEVYR